MSVFIPQYAKSSDASVIAAVERNRDAVQAWRERAGAWAKEHTGDANFYYSGWGRTLHVTGVMSRAEPGPGRWRRAPRNDGWIPFKKNPLYREFARLIVEREPIPGLAESYAGLPDADFRTMVYFPSVFIESGVAYMSLGGIPASDNGKEPFGSDEFDADLWMEILPSEWHAAHERATGKAVSR